MEKFVKWLARTTSLVSAALPLVTGMAMTALAAEAPSGRTYEGAPVSVGHGTASVIVRCDAADMPVSVAVMLSEDALTGLPATLNSETREGSWEYALPMPTQGPKTGYSQVVIDWNPQGHPPPHVYTVPHFDFHFYVAKPDEVQQVSFKGPDDAATKVTDLQLVPKGYRVIPESAINRMGVHAVDLGAPEFHGKPFAATFIYGYYKGRLTFVEPMTTLAFLQTRPDFAQPVNTPEHYSKAAYYPSSYEVRYDAPRRAFLIGLMGLEHWDGMATAKARN